MTEPGNESRVREQSFRPLVSSIVLGAAENKRESSLPHRFRGAFLGCMLGDSIGRPFEMTSARDSRLSEALDRMLERGPWRYTDVTGATHAHALGRAGGVVQAVAIAHVLRRQADPLDPAPLLADLTRLRVVQSTTFAAKLEAVARLLEASVDPMEAVAVLGNGVLAEEAVPLALFSFLRWAPDFATVAKKTVSLGGDTDTTAAMSGALCGALVGDLGLPALWLDKLERGARGREHVTGLADGVFDLWRRLTSVNARPLQQQ
jgi:ADP-ribosylglycohydrolase